MSKEKDGSNMAGEHTLAQPKLKVTPTPPTNVPTKYQLPTPYGLRDIARTRFYKSRSLQQGQRSNQGYTMTLHTLSNDPTKYQLPTPNGF